MFGGKGTFEVFYYNVDARCLNCGYFKTLEELTDWMRKNQEEPYNHQTIILEIHRFEDYDEYRTNRGEKVDKLSEKLTGFFREERMKELGLKTAD